MEEVVDFGRRGRGLQPGVRNPVLKDRVAALAASVILPVVGEDCFWLAVASRTFICSDIHYGTCPCSSRHGRSASGGLADPDVLDA